MTDLVMEAIVICEDGDGEGTEREFEASLIYAGGLLYNQ